MKIGLTYNLKSEAAARRSSRPDGAEETSAEFDTEETVQALARALQKAGHQVQFLGAGLAAVRKILKRRPEFIFNIAEGARGRNREAELPSLFELLQIPYSGSDPLALSATLDKSVAKRLVLQADVRTPDFMLLRSPTDLRKIKLKFPLFVKPLWQGSSIGIRMSSKVENRAALAAEAERLFRNFHDGPLLVEEFIAGREVTVGVLGNDPPYLLGMMEIGFRNLRDAALRLKRPRLASRGGANDFVYSFEVKRDWERLCCYTVPPRLSKKMRERIGAAALRAYEALGCRDVARLDFRVKGGGEAYFLEANPLPGLSPTYGDLVILGRRMGWTYDRLVLTILNHALARNGLLSSRLSRV